MGKTKDLPKVNANWVLTELFTDYISDGEHATTRSLWLYGTRITLTLAPNRYPLTSERVPGQLYIRIGRVRNEDMISASMTRMVARALALEPMGDPFHDNQSDIWILHCKWSISSEKERAS